MEGAANGGKDGGSYRPTTTLSLAALAAGRRRGGAGGDGAWPLEKEKAAAREGGRKEEREGERQGKGDKTRTTRDETGKATVHHPNQATNHLSRSPRASYYFCFPTLLLFFSFSSPIVFMILGRVLVQQYPSYKDTNP
jgi:hypothetical protein